MRAFTIPIMIGFLFSIALPSETEAAKQAKIAPAKGMPLKAKVRAWATPLAKRGWQKVEATLEAPTKMGSVIRTGARLATMLGGVSAIGAGIEAWSRGDHATGGALIGGGINAFVATPIGRKGFATELAIAVVSTSAGAAGGAVVGATRESSLALRLPSEVVGTATTGVPTLFNSFKLMFSGSE